jgi:hypothetical protein
LDLGYVSKKHDRRATGHNHVAKLLELETQLARIKNEILRLPVRDTTLLKILDAIRQDVAIAQANEGRAKWRSDNPRRLTAPAFIKAVWADKIDARGNILRKHIADYDQDLLDAFDAYASQRRRRSLDVGDASGLHLMKGPTPV